MKPVARVRFAVRLTPRAETDRIEGVLGGALRIRVAAPPVAGAANASMLRLVARALRVPATSVRLVGGLRGRDKLVEVDGLDPAVARARWPGLGV